MLPSVWTRSLRDQRRGLAAWATALVLLVGMYAAFFPSMHRSSGYSDLMNQLPEALRNLFTAGVGADLSSGPGFISIELLSFMAPALILIYAIGAATQAVAGEESRHTLDLMLAGPLTRARLVLEKAGAVATGVTLLTGGMAVALVAFGAAAGMGLSTVNVIAAMTHLALLVLVFAGLALCTGAATGSVGLARGVSAATAVGAYLVNGFAPSVSWLTPVRELSPFYQYVGHDPIRHGFSGTSVTVAAITAAVLTGLAVWALRRRDLH